MKRLFFLLSLIAMLSAAQAQTIHWLTFIDTNDSRVGEIDVRGRKVLYGYFINEVNAALAPKGYKSHVLDFYGDATTPANCKAAVRNLRVDPEDIIVFYYIGHGGRPNTDVEYMKQHPYPQMCMQLEKFPESQFIPLEWVYKELSSKGARLSVTIGMCCNSLSNISIKSGPAFTPNYGATYMSDNKIARIQDLFLGVKGSVIATSASPTQTSGCFESDFGVVDAYTTVLCDIFETQLKEIDGTLTWDVLLGSISRIIDSNTGGNNVPFKDRQTPIHETHLVAASQPATTTPTTPSQTEVPKGQGSSENDGSDVGLQGFVNFLSDAFDVLINTNVDEMERIELEQKLNTLFARNAVVRIVGQDGKTLVNKESASVFLGRLATSRLLLKVVPVDIAFDGNSITELYVQEVYRKN